MIDCFDKVFSSELALNVGNSLSRDFPLMALADASSAEFVATTTFSGIVRSKSPFFLSMPVYCYHCNSTSIYWENVRPAINILQARNSYHHQSLPRSYPRRCRPRHGVSHRRSRKDLKFPALISTPKYKSRLTQRADSASRSHQHPFPPRTIPPPRPCIRSPASLLALRRYLAFRGILCRR